jgi:hypothetical protein
MVLFAHKILALLYHLHSKLRHSQLFTYFFQCFYFVVFQEDRIHFAERHVICKLLSNIYVDHPLVFPTRFAPCVTAPESSLFLGFQEDIVNPPITMGKLFNAQSRIRFEGKADFICCTSIRNCLLFLCLHLYTFFIYQIRFHHNTMFFFVSTHL